MNSSFGSAQKRDGTRQPLRTENEQLSYHVLTAKLEPEPNKKTCEDRKEPAWSNL